MISTSQIICLPVTDRKRVRKKQPDMVAELGSNTSDECSSHYRQRKSLNGHGNGHTENPILFGCANSDLLDQIIGLAEEDFWKLVNIRLNVPLSEIQTKEMRINEDCEYWTENYLIEEIFLRIAPIKETIIHEGKKITIYKYYSQALRLAKWIPIAKPQVEFVISISDLTLRIVAELKALGETDSQNILKLAVGKIFENIVGSRCTHTSIIRNLKVRLDK
jgi:hypothetical protein